MDAIADSQPPKEIVSVARFNDDDDSKGRFNLDFLIPHLEKIYGAVDGARLEIAGSRKDPEGVAAVGAWKWAVAAFYVIGVPSVIIGVVAAGAAVIGDVWVDQDRGEAHQREIEVRDHNNSPTFDLTLCENPGTFTVSVMGNTRRYTFLDCFGFVRSREPGGFLETGHP